MLSSFKRIGSLLPARPPYLALHRRTDSENELSRNRNFMPASTLDFRIVFESRFEANSSQIVQTSSPIIFKSGVAAAPPTNSVKITRFRDNFLKSLLDNQDLIEYHNTFKTGLSRTVQLPCQSSKSLEVSHSKLT